MATENEHSRLGDFMTTVLSIVGGAFGGALLHDNNKHEAVLDAQQLYANARASKPGILELLNKARRTGKSAQNLYPGFSPEVVDDAKKLSESFGGYWHSQTRTSKALWGSIAGMVLVAPIVQYILSRGAQKKTLHADLSVSSATGPEIINEEGHQKSFSAALTEERDATVKTPLHRG